jgi:hypothetical protein
MAEMRWCCSTQTGIWLMQQPAACCTCASTRSARRAGPTLWIFAAALSYGRLACRTRTAAAFLRCLRQPSVALALPAPLEDFLALVGRLSPGALGLAGGCGNFSPGFTAPPQFLLAQAAARGFDFRPSPTAPRRLSRRLPRPSTVPAWRWAEGGRDRRLQRRDAD